MSLLNNKDNKKIVEDMNYDDYDNVPIDSFGINMLKKMGWQENKPINGKIQPKPFELKPRHYRLGLGATPLDPTKAIPKSSDAEKIKKEKEKNFFGTKIKIIHGKHKGLKAIIAEKILCEDLNEYLKKHEFLKVELKINKELIRIESKDIKLRSDENREKSGKTKHKKRNKKKKSHNKHRKYSSDSSSSSKSSAKDLKKSEKKNEDKDVLEAKEQIIQFLNKKTNRDKDENKTNLTFNELDDFKKKDFYNDYNAKAKNTLNWVTQNIIVRIINKKNKYYNKEATVVDLPSRDKFTLIVNDCNIVENLTESDIETVIPELGERVIVLKGPSKGEIGEIMQNDFDLGIIYLQMLNDFTIKTFRKDECCAMGNEF